MAFQKECYCAEIRELKIPVKVADLFFFFKYRYKDLQRMHFIGSVCTYHIPKKENEMLLCFSAYLYT